MELRRLVKKVSETSLKSGMRAAAGKKARRVTIAVPEIQGRASRDGGRPLSRRGSVRSAAVDVSKNVVTTIKGKAGGRVLGSKKSIRVIEA